MGSTEKFCLRWNDFESNISSAFRDLRSQKDFFDVTLAVDDDPRHALQAHKVILSACSPFFRNALLAQAAASPLAGMVAPMIYLRGVTYEDLKHVLDFMYHGEVNVAQDDLNSFLAVAEDLKIKGLTQNEGGGAPTPARSFKASSAAKREPPDRGGENGSAKKRPRPQPVPGTSRDDDSGEPSVKAEPSGAGASGGGAGEDDFGDGGGDYGDDYGDYEGDMSYGGGEGDESMGAAMGGTDDAKVFGHQSNVVVTGAPVTAPANYHQQQQMLQSSAVGGGPVESGLNLVGLREDLCERTRDLVNRTMAPDGSCSLCGKRFEAMNNPTRSKVSHCLSHDPSLSQAIDASLEKYVVRHSYRKVNCELCKRTLSVDSIHLRYHFLTKHFGPPENFGNKRWVF